MFKILDIQQDASEVYFFERINSLSLNTCIHKNLLTIIINKLMTNIKIIFNESHYLEM